MATIYADSDAYVYKTHASWNSARSLTTGAAISHTSTGSSFGIQSTAASGRGGGTTYTIYRSFFIFDTSGINQLVESATLSLRGYSASSGDVILVAATSDISTLTTADYDSILDWDDSGTDGSGGGSGEPHLRKYTLPHLITWSTSGYNNITLSANALRDMQNNGQINICVMNYSKDFLDVAPTGTHKNGLYYENYTGTSRDPKITYELSKSNAILMGTNF